MKIYSKYLNLQKLLHANCCYVTLRYVALFGPSLAGWFILYALFFFSRYLRCAVICSALFRVNNSINNWTISNDHLTVWEWVQRKFLQSGDVLQIGCFLCQFFLLLRFMVWFRVIYFFIIRFKLAFWSSVIAISRARELEISIEQIHDAFGQLTSKDSTRKPLVWKIMEIFLQNQKKNRCNFISMKFENGSF